MRISLPSKSWGMRAGRLLGFDSASAFVLHQAWSADFRKRVFGDTSNEASRDLCRQQEIALSRRIGLFDGFWAGAGLRCRGHNEALLG